MSKKNKVKFNICNVHYALLSLGEDGEVTFGAPVAMPNIESQTNEEEIEVQTETLVITASPLANGYVKARTGDATTEAVYKDWYKNVYLPPKDNGGSDTPAPAGEPAANRMVRSASAPDVVSTGDGKNKA